MKRELAGAVGAVLLVTAVQGVDAQPRRIRPTRVRPNAPAAPAQGGPQRVDANGNPVVPAATPRETEQCLQRCDTASEVCSGRCPPTASRCVRGCVTQMFECRMRCPAVDGGVAGFSTAGLERYAPH